MHIIFQVHRSLLFSAFSKVTPSSLSNSRVFLPSPGKALYQPLDGPPSSPGSHQATSRSAHLTHTRPRVGASRDPRPSLRPRPAPALHSPTRRNNGPPCGRRMCPPFVIRWTFGPFSSFRLFYELSCYEHPHTSFTWTSVFISLGSPPGRAAPGHSVAPCFALRGAARPRPAAAAPRRAPRARERGALTSAPPPRLRFSLRVWT